MPGPSGRCACPRRRSIRRRWPDSNRPPAYVNENSHWWDGSQDLRQHARRAGEAAHRPERQGQGAATTAACSTTETPGTEITGMPREPVGGAQPAARPVRPRAQRHLRPADAGASRLGRQRLFQQARLVVNAALMAKIHTIEWTPAILPHPLLVLALNTNWYGVAAGTAESVSATSTTTSLLSGIPGSPTDHHTAPYSLTEEFAAGLPHALADSGRFHDPVGQGREAARAPSSCRRCRAAPGARCSRSSTAPISSTRSASRIPGALRLHNFPKHLQNLHKDTTGERFDLAAVDILRDRERGVPRYNQFRRLFHKPPVKTLRGALRQPGVGRGDQARLRRRHREGGPAGRPDGRAAARRASASATRRSACSS